jgi:spore maturation protein CgeB
MSGMRIAFFGSSLVSSYWNGACTYYRGIIRALHERGHRTTFYEPRAFERQEHRDIPDPDWANVVVYEPEDAARAVEAAAGADLVVKASGVGVNDALLERTVLDLPGRALRVFWDVDAPATLARIEGHPDDPLAERIGDYDCVLTYGGGDPVVRRYEDLGARECVPIYNALDPATHHPAPARGAFRADLTFLGNRLPDREARVHEFFLRAAREAPERRFLLAGNGWSDVELPANVRVLGHVGTADHNALNSSALAVLNVTRAGMAANGWSPPTRVFEAAGAGACLITDAWRGIEDFLSPGDEVLVAADGAEVAASLCSLDPVRASAIGAAARERVLAEHTYRHRAAQLEAVLDRLLAGALG